MDSFPFFLRFSSSSHAESKWSSMALLDFPVIIMNSVIPHFSASSTAYCIIGLSTIGSISFGGAFVAGKNLVPSPAVGSTAFLTFFVMELLLKMKKKKPLYITIFLQELLVVIKNS